MVELAPWEIRKDDVSGVGPLPKLETSGFKSFKVVIIRPLSTQIFTLTPMQHHSFFKTTKKFVCRKLLA